MPGSYISNRINGNKIKTQFLSLLQGQGVIKKKVQQKSAQNSNSVQETFFMKQ
jgi:hypothetical protein